MKLRDTLFALLFLPLIFITSCNKSDDTNDAKDKAYYDMIDTYSKTGEHDLMLEAMELSNIKELLDDSKKYTVFLPTDKAMTEMMEEEGLTSLSEMDNEKLNQMVMLHVAEGAYTMEALKAMGKNQDYFQSIALPSYLGANINSNLKSSANSEDMEGYRLSLITNQTRAENPTINGAEVLSADPFNFQFVIATLTRAINSASTSVVLNERFPQFVVLASLGGINFAEILNSYDQYTIFALNEAGVNEYLELNPNISLEGINAFMMNSIIPNESYTYEAAFFHCPGSGSYVGANALSGTRFFFSACVDLNTLTGDYTGPNFDVVPYLIRPSSSLSTVRRRVVNIPNADHYTYTRRRIARENPPISTSGGMIWVIKGFI